MGNAKEGIMHANIVLQEDILDYAALFGEIADAYYERGMWLEERPTGSVYIILQIASYYRMLDELKEAADIYEHVCLSDPKNNDAKMKLLEIYKIMNEPRKALDLVYQVIDSRKRCPKKPISAQQQWILHRQFLFLALL
ncbi:hypothetical protein BT96DRAFT_1003722 [Gymnopus androsaceus JB14]|uniref:Uncharacterized protein n=1 Tax=Gymnopus androsaceus JB14 TaxID=1447944 RepID=A0A6A4GUE1_9AGAR|nr:hypothetical protein BT96DRAFT_1003722 [Gymnopus androsaceus JB14]